MPPSVWRPHGRPRTHRSFVPHKPSGLRTPHGHQGRAGNKRGSAGEARDLPWPASQAQTGGRTHSHSIVKSLSGRPQTCDWPPRPSQHPDYPPQSSLAAISEYISAMTDTETENI